MKNVTKRRTCTTNSKLSFRLLSIVWNSDCNLSVHVNLKEKSLVRFLDTFATPSILKLSWKLFYSRMLYNTGTIRTVKMDINRFVLKWKISRFGITLMLT